MAKKNFNVTNLITKTINIIEKKITKIDLIHFFAFLLILLLAIIIRILFLFLPIMYDEAYSFLHFIAKPLKYGLSVYTMPNNHIFHTFLAHTTYLIFGNHLWALRLPALLAGILLVPASYLVIRIFYNKHAALLASALVASSSILIEYSVNARGYTLVCLFFLILIILIPHLIKNKSKISWLFFAVISALGFYTTPIMLYPVGIIMTWIFIYSGFKKLIFKDNFLLKNLFIYSMISIIITFFLYLPVLIVSGLGAIIGNRFVQPESWSIFFHKIPILLNSIWSQWNQDIPLAMQIILVISFFTYLITYKKMSNYRIPIIWPILIFLPTFFIFQHIIPPGRVFLFLLPLYLSLSAVGLSYLINFLKFKRPLAKAIIFAVLSVMLSFYLNLNIARSSSIYYSNDTGNLRGAEQITIFLKNYLNPGDVIYTTIPSDAPLYYYFIKHGIPSYYLLNNSFVESASNKPDRIFIIVNLSSKPPQTLNYLLNITNINNKTIRSNYYYPELIKKYELVDIYQINKINK